jgi:formylglycine-generating enzyme required for sulfatase activity
VTVPGSEIAAFQIDRTEVRVSEYRRCVEEGACAPPAVAAGCNWNAPGRGDHPVNCIDWDQAATYCSWIGKRLPTEQEWEKAARGTDGLFDTAGNVDEWTGSSYDSGSGARVLRGGPSKNDAAATRSFRRQGALPNLRDPSVAFRCAEGAIVAETRAR